MTSSDPKSKTAMVVDEDDDEEYEYEEIEVEEEVEEEVEDEEEEVEYEEVEVEEEEEEEEVEEVEEEEEVEEVEEEEEVEEVEVEEEYEEVEEEVEVEEEEEEIEYEEVEEEVEYEEVEEEVDDVDGDSDGEEEKEEIDDKLPIEAKGDGKIDVNSHMDCIEHDIHSRQHSAAVECDTSVSLDTHPIDATKHGSGDEMLAISECPITAKSEANIPSDIEASGIFGLGDTSIKSDEKNREGNRSSLAESGTSNIPKLLEYGVGVHGHQCSGIKDESGSVGKSIPADVTVKQCSALDRGNGQMGEEDKATAIVVTSAVNVEPVDDGNHKASRSSLQVRHRSPSPEAGHEDGNKRPAVICEYFAKGWCIKGSSCRFLHKRDHIDDHSQKVEGGMLASNSKHQIGSGDVAGRSKLLAHFQSDVGINDDALPSSSALINTQLQHVEKDKTALYEKEVASRISASSQASPCNDKTNSIFDPKEVEGEIFKENYSFDLYNYREAAITGSGDGSVQHGLGQGSQSYSKYRLPHSGMRETAFMRKHYSLDGFGSSGSIPYSSFVSSDQRNSSPYVECDAAKVSHMSTSKGLLISSKYKSSFVPHNWEPSVPFRPSFFIPSMIRTSSNVQYDPLRDSIEQPDVRHLSSHKRGSIFEDVQSISGRNALETNKNLHHDTWDENYCGHNKEVAPADSAEASTNDVQNKNTFQEENPVIPASVKDMLRASRNAADVNFNSQIDGMGDDKVIVTEKERKSGHLDEEESKVIKYFRGALIEFVKELMKPVWHEGRLSKDVYKVIVQKAEDKILSTLPSDKVPNTSESIEQYLSLSRPKILKLIQAYVDKYGKF